MSCDEWGMLPKVSRVGVIRRLCFRELSVPIRATLINTPLQRGDQRCGEGKPFQRFSAPGPNRYHGLAVLHAAYTPLKRGLMRRFEIMPSVFLTDLAERPSHAGPMM